MIDVLIAGAGPAGLMLAGELRLAGVETVVIEREPEPPGFCRGFTLNARSLDLLARRGLADGLIAEGWQVPHAAFSGLPVTLALAGTMTGHPFTLGIPQTRVEEVLEQRARDLGAEIRRGHDLRTLRQDADGVEATVVTARGESRLRARYLVGCDGGRSTVRKQAGIPFPGTGPDRFWLLGDVEADLPFGQVTGPGGAVTVIPRPGYARVITADPGVAGPVTLGNFSNAVDKALGRHVELSGPRWLTRYGDTARQAAAYVDGRVILVGDAAHVQPPAGSIGVNVALDDAVNLGWKLAATVRGDAPAHLLATYHAERHPAGARVLANTRAQVALGEAGAGDPVVDLFTRVAANPAGNRALAETIVGLDTRCDVHPAGDHPWAGRLAPDLPLRTDKGTTTLATLLTPGRGILLDLTGSRAFGAAGVDVVTATCAEAPGLGALLLRPDGHVAWVARGGHGDDGLAEALRYWFGS